MLSCRQFGSLVLVLGLNLNVSSADAQPRIKDPQLRAIYEKYIADCKNPDLPPDQMIQACDIAKKAATYESDAAAQNAINQLIHQSLGQ